RLLTWNLPKPVSVTSPPRESVPSTVSRKASTASAACFFVRPALLATCSTTSDLVIFALLDLVLPAISAPSRGGPYHSTRRAPPLRRGTQAQEEEAVLLAQRAQVERLAARERRPVQDAPGRASDEPRRQREAELVEEARG